MTSPNFAQFFDPPQPLSHLLVKRLEHVISNSMAPPWRQKWTSPPPPWNPPWKHFKIACYNLTQDGNILFIILENSLFLDEKLKLLEQ